MNETKPGRTKNKSRGGAGEGGGPDISKGYQLFDGGWKLKFWW